MTSGHGPHTSATISDVVLTSPWVLSVCVGEQWVSCNSKSLCAGVLGPCHVALLSRSACRKCLLLHLRVLASRMPMELFVNLAPPLLEPQACISEQLLSSCLLLCYIVSGSASMCSPSVLLDLPMGICLAFSSARSSCLVFFWYPFSPVVCPLVLIFWD